MGDTTGYFRYDRVRVLQNGEPADLQVESETKDVRDSAFTNIGDGLGRWIAPTIGERVDDGFHTAFGVSMLAKNGNIVIGQSEGTGHPLTAGTIPVVYTSSDNGKTYTKQSLSLVGISSANLDDIRNVAGGMEDDGTLWLFATDYRNAAEILPSRLWYWTSLDSGVTWSTPLEITYNNSTYDLLTTYGELIDMGNGVLILPAYGGNGGLAESYAVQLKSNDGGLSWTATKIYTGDITATSDYITETFILRTSGNNLIAIGRREQSYPRLFSSGNAGASWTSEGVLTVFPSIQCHAPWLYKDFEQVSCLYSDRTGLNVGRISVVENYTDDAEWNAAKVEVIVGSVTQRGYGAYNYGYCSTVGTGPNRMMVWYDISLNEDTPASLSNALTAIILTPLVGKPMFLATILNSSFTAGGTEEDIEFAPTLIDCDNYGGLERTNFKRYTVPEDGIYQISCNLRVSSMGFASYAQLTIYSNFVSTAFNDQTYGQAGAIGQGFGFLGISGTRRLRKGEEIYFKFFSSASGPLTTNLDDTPIFSIYKVN